MGTGDRDWRTRAVLVLAGMAVVGLVACGGEDAPTEPVGGSVVNEALLADAELGSAIDELTQDIGLSDDQRAPIQELVANGRDRAGEPGAAWYAAAELQGILTSEQIAELDSRMANTRDRIGMKHGERSEMRARDGGHARDGAGSFGRMSGGAHGYAGLELTEEQRTQIRAVLESHQAELDALREELRSGDLSREEMRSRAESVHEAIRAKIEPLLTQEQRDQLQERESRFEEHRVASGEHRETALERREAQHAAMVDALELTDAQIEVLDALGAGRSGGSARAGDESRSEIHEAHRAAMAEVLTEEQQEIVTLHRALATHRFQAAAHEGRRRGHGEHRTHPGGHGGHAGFMGT
jgi:Spy/CpxP family protein refolding chaperone